MTLIRKFAHWILSHPGHTHHYSLHVERDDEGNVKPYWKCMFVLCDKEEEIDEWV